MSALSVATSNSASDIEDDTATSIVSEMNNGTSIASSTITANSSSTKSEQSSGQKSDSSDDTATKFSVNGVSFASNKEIRMYEVEEGSLNRKLSKNIQKKN
mmetsp:Transcript_21931/g.33171  ORF Transcript_21931/g.33171 Transcript_21931/m.33171 type:complete len:101 (-) Transcript_21931:10-312(-)